MKAYIQRINKEIPDDWVWSAMNGLRNKGFDISYFEEEDITTIPCTGKEVVVAYIEPTTTYLNHHGITIPKPLNIPMQLHRRKYTHRGIGYTRMGVLKADREMVDIFVKPADRVKGFSSGIITQHSLKPFVFSDVTDGTGVMTSSLVDFVSEYRCFVHKGELKGIQWYLGDFKLFPNVEVIQEMIDVYTEAPVAYTLDVGLIKCEFTPGGYKTALVECNDMWSVTHYGLRDQIYSTLLRDRWFEIIRDGLKANQAASLGNPGDDISDERAEGCVKNGG